MENAKYTFKEELQAIRKLAFGEDTCNINRYVQERTQINDTVSVDRSFSMLQKLIAKDRNLKVKQVKHHMTLRFNSFT